MPIHLSTFKYQACMHISFKNTRDLMSTHSSSKFFSTWAKEKRQFRNLEVKPIGLNHVSLKGTTAVSLSQRAGLPNNHLA